MSASPWVFWAVLIGGLVFAGAMLYLAWWSLFGDKSRGRARCPRCWYDMTGSPTTTCSECGHAARSERELHHTRRRWLTATLAILAITAEGLYVIDFGMNVGMVSIAPTRLLIAALPLENDVNGSLRKELGLRMVRGQMSDRDVTRLFDRLITGDWSARPPSQEWIDRYGLLILSWRHLLPEDSPIHQRLAQVPANVDVRIPERWPAHEPLAAQLRMTDFWPVGMQCRIEWAMAGQDSPLRFRRASGRPSPRLAIPLPALPAGEHSIPVRLRIETQPDPGAEWSMQSEQTITLRTRIVDESPPALEPAADDVLTASMKAIFDGSVMKWDTGPSPVRIRYRPSATQTPEWDGVAIGIVVELMRDDQVARRLRLWWRGGEDLSFAIDRIGSELPEEDLPLLRLLNGNDGRWTMRVRSDAALARRVEGATRWWTGEFTIPLRVSEHSSTAPQRSWWRESPNDEVEK